MVHLFTIILSIYLWIDIFIFILSTAASIYPSIYLSINLMIIIIYAMLPWQPFDVVWSLKCLLCTYIYTSSKVQLLFICTCLLCICHLLGYVASTAGGISGIYIHLWFLYTIHCIYLFIYIYIPSLSLQFHSIYVHLSIHPLYVWFITINN